MINENTPNISNLPNSWGESFTLPKPNTLVNFEWVVFELNQEEIDKYKSFEELDFIPLENQH